jgi:hypothetical protein
MMHLLWFGPIGLAMSLLGRPDPSQQLDMKGSEQTGAALGALARGQGCSFV